MGSAVGVLVTAGEVRPGDRIAVTDRWAVRWVPVAFVCITYFGDGPGVVTLAGEGLPVGGVRVDAGEAVEVRR